MKTLRLTVIGSGDAFGSGGRLNTCFYIETPAVNFLLDCGGTVLHGLKKNRLTSNDVDTIFISHFHGDHYGGLPYFLLDAATFHRTKPLTIVSPPGCRTRVIQLLALLYPGSEVLNKLTIDFIEYTALQEIGTEDWNLLPYPVIHSEATAPHGLRVSVAGKIISYSGDTGWNSNLIRLSNNADLFICECNFFESQLPGHLSYQLLKEKLALFTCERIVLTHFDDEMLENLKSVTLQCAFDGMTLEI